MTLDEILDDVGVRIIRPEQTRHPGETCASSTINKIFEQYGAAHLALVLRIFCETHEANRDAILGPAIWAVSDIILGHPKFIDAGGALFDAFDNIDLTALLAIARANIAAVPVRPAVATLLYRRLSEALFPKAEPKPSSSLKGMAIRLACPAA
jgi:hypothetical protein